MENMTDLINEYQCPGCISGHDSGSCPAFRTDGYGCAAHVPATFGIRGVFVLGMPKGFRYIGERGEDERSPVYLYDHIDESRFHPEWLNIPVWKHLDDNGNTIIRMFNPRVNNGSIAVFRGNHMDAPVLRNSIEVTKEMQEEID